MTIGRVVGRVAFAGTPAFAVPTLRAIVAAGHDVPLVLTQPDRPAGRGRKLTPPPVKQAALESGLRVEQPESVADPAMVDRWGLADAPPDLLVVVAYGLLLPQWLLNWPRRGCINVHASLLPRWRGAAPIQHAILAGDAATGVSLMHMERGLDTGPVYAMRDTAIGPDDTAVTLHDRLAELGAQLAAEYLPALLDGTAEPTPQDDARSTYAVKIAKADARLDWSLTAEELGRRVRAYVPWPIAFCELPDGGTLRVHEARPLASSAGSSAPPGRVVAASAEGIDVATGRGVLRLTRVQPPSSRVMEAGAYLAAHPLEGVILG